MAITKSRLTLLHATSENTTQEFYNDEINPFTVTYESVAEGGLSFVETQEDTSIQYIKLYSDATEGRTLTVADETGLNKCTIYKTGEYYLASLYHTIGTSIIIHPTSVLTENISKVEIGYTNGTTETAYTTPSEPTPTPVEPTVDLFVLPRPDWYDEDGRIYRDALIENFNALEYKFNEFARISAFSTDIPDISDLHLEEVDLTSDDNKVVSLESFINIFDLVNYPIEIVFGDKSIKKISYWNSEYHYITRKDIDVSVTDTNRFVIYNFSDNTARVASSVTLDTDEALIGCYILGRIMSLTTPYEVRLNLMYLLGNMPKGSISGNWGKSGSLEKDYKWFPKGSKGKQCAGLVSAESDADNGYRNGRSLFRQEGRID